MNIIIFGTLLDEQSGPYIHNSFITEGHDSHFIDTRAILNDHGADKGQDVILEETKNVHVEPDLVLILKGLEMSPKTVRALREKYKDAKFVNWFFDVYMVDREIWKNEVYLEVLKLYDYFFCSLKGVAEILRELGYKNVYHLPEACYPKKHDKVYMNSFQKKKYGEDISFCGTVGFLAQHNNRIEILSSIIKEGFNIKIWGTILNESRKIPKPILENCVGIPAINETHSMVSEASKINLGIDQDPSLAQSWSARLYRVLCAEGLYLSTETKELTKIFKCYPNEGEYISDDQELVVFTGKTDLITKIDYLLEHDDLRAKIAKNGRKKVLELHTFAHRVRQMIKMVNNESL